jgi:hypothetical protein
MITDDHYSDIQNWLKVINTNKKRSKIFYAEGDDEFMADGKLFKMIPSEYCKYATFDEFYLHINVKTKEILFQAWNIENFDELRRSTIESGVLNWEKMEFSVLTFITTNISKLSYTSGALKNHFPMNGSVTTHTTYPQQQPYSHKPYVPPVSIYNDGDYKEREVIREKFTALVKQNKTGLAVELLESAITKMCENKKFSGLDLFLTALPTEYMNIPAMFSVLKVTCGADHILRDRRGFFEKVKSRLSKTGKLNKMLDKLNEVEPGKEYVGITKYSNEPTEIKANAAN